MSDKDYYIYQLENQIKEKNKLISNSIKKIDKIVNHPYLYTDQKFNQVLSVIDEIKSNG